MNNASAIGYAIMVLKEMGLDARKIDEFAVDMESMMEHFTEEEAEEFYRNN